MYLNRYTLRNFRRLEFVEIKLEENDTIFVGANNSGKTSATIAFKLFVSQQSEFKIYDFPSPLIPLIDRFGEIEHQPTITPEISLPAIELDLWFSVTSAIYGRIAHLMPSISSEYSEVGIRISFAINSPEDLYAAYNLTYPKPNSDEKTTQRKTMSYYLSQGGNLKRFYGLHYFVLEKNPALVDTDGLSLYPIEKDEGKKTLDSLLHVNFIEAQRNIDDNNSTRSNRLSVVIANFYKNNLEKQGFDNESIKIIDSSNFSLTNHYAQQFSPLLNVIKALGFPALNDRELRIISNLNPEQVLNGNTELTYLEKGTDHELPEAYNGLGYKNLIYIAIQIANYQIQWAGTGVNRPLCQLVFIEEPEVHLHAQVQQTFIRQIRNVMKEIADLSEYPNCAQQLVITTHSSHIVAEADFQLIRYFRRTKSKYQTKTDKLIATEVLSLANFSPTSEEQENLKFLKKYIKLTHCDLFFADAAILVEGTVEKLLLPLIIEKVTPELESAYLTTLELGGAYAHKFIQLLKFINLPTLVITDIDSVDPTSKDKKCRADLYGAKTSNDTIKVLTKKELVSDLLKLTTAEKLEHIDDFQRYITYQLPVPVPCYGENRSMIPRTFEEAFIYQNISLVRENKLLVSLELEKTLDFETDYSKVYSTINSKNYKKVEFALAQIETSQKWEAPDYIVQGLKWLRDILKLTPEPKPDNAEGN